MRRKTFLMVLVAAMVLIAGTVYAGWVEEETDGTKTFISGKKVRIVPSSPDEPGMIIDAGAGHITMLNAQRKVYASGTPQEFCAAFKKMRDDQLKGLSPEERRLMDHMMGQLETKRKQKPTIEVKKKGKGGKIAGYSTDKYLVLLDGKDYEEFWLAPGLKAMKEKDMEAFMKLMGEFSACTASSMGMGGMNEITPELSDAYLDVMKTGWLLKSVSLASPYGGPQVSTEVRELKKKSISSAELSPPKGYRKVSTGEFIQSGEDMSGAEAPAMHGEDMEKAVEAEEENEEEGSTLDKLKGLFGR